MVCMMHTPLQKQQKHNIYFMELKVSGLRDYRI